MSERDRPLEITIHDIRRGQPDNGYLPVDVVTDRGDIGLRYYDAPGATAGVICVGGTGGGWDSPGRGGLYPRLCDDMRRAGISALRVRYRQPTVLEESVLDVLTGIHMLEEQGLRQIGIVGHSFGGAVAAQAAANAKGIRALVVIGTQTYGLDAVRDLPPGCATLFVHGEDDQVLPPSCAKYGYGLAREPRYLRIFGGAGHCLDEVADQLRDELKNWLLMELGVVVA